MGNGQLFMIPAVKSENITHWKPLPKHPKNKSQLNPNKLDQYSQVIKLFKSCFMTLVKHPITNFTEREEKRRKENRDESLFKIIGTILFIVMLVSALLLRQCNS